MYSFMIIQLTTVYTLTYFSYRSSTIDVLVVFMLIDPTYKQRYKDQG